VLAGVASKGCPVIRNLGILWVHFGRTLKEQGGLLQFSGTLFDQRQEMNSLYMIDWPQVTPSFVERAPLKRGVARLQWLIDLLHVWNDY